MRALCLSTLVVLSACGSPSTTGAGGGGGGSTATGGGGGVAASVTWYKDVAPIVQRSCLGCHAAGGIGPFSLESYAQAQPMAGALANAVASKRMPPWMPSATCGGPFIGARVLPQAEIDTISAWASAGAPAGAPADAPAPPDGGVATLPQVDATLAMPEPYTPSATLTDDYRCFILDPAITGTKQVTGYDIAPGQRAEVHHVILYVVDRAAAKAQDALDATPGWQCFGGAGVSSSGALGAWAPGSGAVIYPTGGITLKASQVLAMQIHYNTTAGVRVADTSHVKLMYATSPVTTAFLLPLVGDGFVIPPSATGYSYTKAFPNQYGLPIKIWGLLPHMHTLGKHITLRGAGDACLVDIPQWDFHWQQSYFTAAPHVINAGQQLSIECTWDNPSTRTIRWGESTSDEMCFAYVYATL